MAFKYCTHNSHHYVEAVFLALHLTTGWREIDRIPVSFKTQVAGKHVHRHIVLLVRSKESGEFGALGISRRRELACKELAGLPIDTRNTHTHTHTRFRSI